MWILFSGWSPFDERMRLCVGIAQTDLKNLNPFELFLLVHKVRSDFKEQGLQIFEQNTKYVLIVDLSHWSNGYPNNTWLSNRLTCGQQKIIREILRSKLGLKTKIYNKINFIRTNRIQGDDVNHRGWITIFWVKK